MPINGISSTILAPQTTRESRPYDNGSDIDQGTNHPDASFPLTSDKQNVWAHQQQIPTITDVRNLFPVIPTKPKPDFVSIGPFEQKQIRRINFQNWWRNRRWRQRGEYRRPRIENPPMPPMIPNPHPPD